MKLSSLCLRLSSLVLSAAFLLCGCGQASMEPADSASAVESDSLLPDKPDAIRWISHDGLWPENGQAEWDAEYERLTGIRLQHQYITGSEYDQRIALYADAGTLPDVFDLGYTFYPEYAAADALADLTELVHSSGLYERVDESLWAQVTLDGKIYGVPKERPQGRGTYVRKDWLDRLGMEIPTTYEEFLTMLRRFRDEIPECVIPYTAPDLVSAAYLPEFYQGMQTEIIPIDGIWVDGMQQPGMLTALNNLQSAYAEGLLDPDAATNTTAACRDAWMTGSVGAFCYWAGNWGQQLTEGLQKNVPDAEVICIPPIEGAVYLYNRPSVHVINANLSPEKITQVFQYFIAYMHDGGEGQRLFNYGVERLHWKSDHDKIIMLPSLSDPTNANNKAYILPSASITPLSSGRSIAYPRSYTQSLEVVNSTALPQFFQPVSPTYTRIAGELTALRNDIIARVVTGGLSAEEGLAIYVEQANVLGLPQALAEMNS